MQVDVERERQLALAEAVVRHMDTHELVAIASGRLGAGGSRPGRRGSSGSSHADQTPGISEVCCLVQGCQLRWNGGPGK